MAEQKPEIVVSFEGVKMKEFRAYWASVARSDWAAQDTFFARVVKIWAYNFDPSDPTSYGELTFEQYSFVQAVIRQFSQDTVSKSLKYFNDKMGQSKMGILGG